MVSNEWVSNWADDPRTSGTELLGKSIFEENNVWRAVRLALVAHAVIAYHISIAALGQIEITHP